MKTLLFASVLIAISASSAPAQVITLDGPDHKIAVWKNLEATHQALQLEATNQAQTNPKAYNRLIACVVSSGTTAMITKDHGDVALAYDIRITSGARSGCRGTVINENVIKQCRGTRCIGAL